MQRPTYEELAELVVAQAAEIALLKARIIEQDARIADLERRLGMNSKNSSTPPSSEGLGKPSPESLRKPSGRKPGGQPGRQGRTLRQVADPDEIVRHEPSCCQGCGDTLAAAAQTGFTRRQVFDLPPVRVRVVEHQLISRQCACGAVTTADAPESVNAPVQYGPRILAVIVYLYMGQYLSKNRTAKAMAELFDTPVSEGTVGSATARAANDLSAFGITVADRIAAADLAHFDETGFRAAGKLHWLHSASTAMFTAITCHRRRGKIGMDAGGVLPRFTGTAVHDAWAPYDTYPQITHALCNAHVQRELVAVTEYHDDNPTASGIESWCWAQQVIDSLLVLKDHADGSPTPVAPETLAHHRQSIVHAARIGVTDSPQGKVGDKHRALARRLIHRIEDYLRFATDPTVPWDNNAAEREIRMPKLRQKVSGGMRTLTGAEHFAALRSYIATTGKHGIDTLDALTKLTTGNPWIPETT
jgi:transposase